MTERGHDGESRGEHTEIWAAINLSREKAHELSNEVIAMRERIHELREWRATQESEQIKHGKELVSIATTLSSMERAQRERTEEERERFRRMMAVFTIIVSVVGLVSGVVVPVIIRVIWR